MITPFKTGIQNQCIFYSHIISYEKTIYCYNKIRFAVRLICVSAGRYRIFLIKRCDQL